MLGRRALRETVRTPEAIAPTLFIPMFFLVVNLGQAGRIFPSHSTPFLHGQSYAAFQLLTRASYAADDTRTPTLVNLGATLGGAALMVVWFSLVSGGDRVVVLGLAHSAAMVAGAATLYVVLRRRIGRDSPVTGALARSVACAVVAGGLARALADVLGDATRSQAAITVAVAGTVAAAVYLAIQWALRAPELRGLGLRAEVSGS